MHKDLIDCENNKLLKKSPPNQEMIKTEINASDYDLDSAKRDLSFDDHKWAIPAYISDYKNIKKICRPLQSFIKI